MKCTIYNYADETRIHQNAKNRQAQSLRAEAMQPTQTLKRTVQDVIGRSARRKFSLRTRRSRPQELHPNMALLLTLDRSF